MFEIINLSKSYGKKEIISGLSLSFEPGVYALLGPNGAGKSTLLNAIAQIIPYNEGQILYSGVDVKENESFFNDIAYLPQSAAFYPNYNAKEMLTYLGVMKGLNKEDIDELIPRLLAEVNLSDVGKKHIKSYSGGMRQRLGIAQSLLNDPKILIFDEPLNGLDPKERMRFRNLIASLSKDKIIIIATHIVNDVVSLADRVLLFNHGRIIDDNSVSNLCESIQGKVYEVQLENDSLLKGLNVSKLELKDGLYTARIVGEVPNFDYKVIEDITLEDVYLYHFGSDL